MWFKVLIRLVLLLGSTAVYSNYDGSVDYVVVKDSNGNPSIFSSTHSDMMFKNYFDNLYVIAARSEINNLNVKQIELLDSPVNRPFLFVPCRREFNSNLCFKGSIEETGVKYGETKNSYVYNMGVLRSSFIDYLVNNLGGASSRKFRLRYSSNSELLSEQEIVLKKMGTLNIGDLGNNRHDIYVNSLKQFEKLPKECASSYFKGMHGITCDFLKYDIEGTLPHFISIELEDKRNVQTKAGVIFFNKRDPNYNQIYSNHYVNMDDFFYDKSGVISVFIPINVIQEVTSSDSQMDSKYFRLKVVGIGEFLSNKIAILGSSFGLNILLKESGISIRPKKPNNNYASGNLSASDITLDYEIKTSSSHQVDLVTAQVVGTGNNINGKAYCIFNSRFNEYKVPIPVYLQFTNSFGQKKKYENNCIEPPVDITQGAWAKQPWINGNGAFNSTDIRLIFKMNDDISKRTISGEEWFGEVYGKGVIRVVAKWNGNSK